MKKGQKRSIEVEGGTVEDAIQKGMKLLGVSRAEIDVKIVSEEKKGLFGMDGEKPAKIKISLKKNKNNS